MGITQELTKTFFLKFSNKFMTITWDYLIIYLYLYCKDV
jgi:hypothetical protein